MHRRDLLASIVPALAGTGLVTRERETPPRPGRWTPFLTAADGTPLFYRDWAGAGGAAAAAGTVVFVAPWALHSGWFEYQMTALAAAGLRCVAYDRRGHGRSGEPGRGYDFETLTDDLRTVIERLELRDVTLVGHSLGAGEVVRYLSRFRQRHVRRAVFIAPISPFALKTADNPGGADRSAMDRGREALASDRPGQLAQAAPGFFGTDRNTVSAATLDWWVDMMVQGCSLKVMLDLHRLFTETDFRPDLRAIRLPTLIVQGDRDTSTPLESTGRPWSALIGGSTLKVYPDAAHGLPITHKAQLNADLLAFIRS
jgi:pimeloyl-ACP methyl ester carboxylesterase